MQVKCRICGKSIDRLLAYKIETNSGNKYYCSIDEYEAEENKKNKASAEKAMVYKLICDILGEDEIVNTILFKEWQIWLKVADNEKIAKYLEENKYYLTTVISRLNSSEFARIRYLSAIIKDKIKGFVPKPQTIETPKTAIDQTLYETSKQTTNKRRSLADLEDEF